MKRKHLLFSLALVLVISILNPTAYANLTKNQMVYNTEKLLNHATKLVTVELRIDSYDKPYLDFTAEKAHDEIQLLDSISNQRVYTNVWLKAEDGEWGDAGTYLGVKEEFSIEAKDYFEDIDNYEGAVYEVKFRYYFDNKYYPAAGKTGDVFSPFSNVITHGLPEYNGAGSCAVTMLEH